MPQPPLKPSVFIGSSKEGYPIAAEVQVHLAEHACEPEIWDQGVFGLTMGTLESLVLALDRFDFSILVLTADDITISKGLEKAAARDNVLFEAGLFIGGLGRERTFLLYDKSNPPSLPSDLAGVTAVTFEPYSTGNLRAALGAACTKIRNVIEKRGVRESKRFQELSAATKTLEDADLRMADCSPACQISNGRTRHHISAIRTSHQSKKTCRNAARPT